VQSTSTRHVWGKVHRCLCTSTHSAPYISYCPCVFTFSEAWSGSSLISQTACNHWPDMCFRSVGAPFIWSTAHALLYPPCPVFNQSALINNWTSGASQEIVERLSPASPFSFLLMPHSKPIRRRTRSRMELMRSDEVSTTSR
jgi:hypothetical protein